MEIHWRNPDAVELRERGLAEARIEDLARDHTDLIDVWLEFDASGHSGIDTAKIRCQARDAELVATERDLDPRVALHRALDTFEREVKKMRERRLERRTQRPDNAPPVHGVVDRTFPREGFGFIIAGGEEVYFHKNALKGGLDIANLEEGMPVSLNVEPGMKGPQATVVLPRPPGAPAF